MTDWYPTLLSLAGIESDSLGLDGVDQSAALFEGEDLTPREILVNELGTAGLDTYRGVIQNAQGIYSNIFDFIIGIFPLFHVSKAV